MAADSDCSAELGNGGNLVAGLMAVTGLMALVLILSGIFHSVLRRLGQPSIISHILAGIVVGPTVLGRLVDLRSVGIGNTGSALSSTIYYARILFMFFIGLEMDFRYLHHTLRRSVVLACGGSAICLVLAAIGGPFFYGLTNPGQGFKPDELYAATGLLMLVVTSTASPVLIRIVTELKLTGSDIGQLAIGAAFANDIACLFTISMMSASPIGEKGEEGTTSWVVWFWMSVTLWIAVAGSVKMANVLNKLKRGRQYISKYELAAMLVLIVGLSLIVQIFGYSASMTGFLLGLVMPRDGPTARTLVDRLTYTVHHFIMPLCFGAIGARLDFAELGGYSGVQLTVAVAFITSLSVCGKVAGTVLAGRLLNISARESVVLGFLMNVKGYSDILAINFASKHDIWGDRAQLVLLLSSVICTFMAGPASAAIVRQQRRAFRYSSHCLQDLKLEDELRVLACVHGPGGVGPMLTLAELSQGAAPLAVYLLHLVELMSSRKYAITHLYHQRTEEENVEDEWGYGGHIRDIEQVVAAASAFTCDTGVPVRQMTAISNILSMDADVRNGVEDAHASLVLVPFHKEQRYDGRMVCRREGRRELNQRLLQRAPCTVGILVERHLVSIAATSMENPTESRVARDVDHAAGHHVVAVFLGGPDDREVVAYATRLAAHPSVSVMVARFLPKASLDGNSRCGSLRTSKSGGDLVTVIGEEDEESSADEEFMDDFYKRFVVSGNVSYTERYVSNGAETVMALGSMVGMFSLFVVGKGGGASSLTTGIGDWDQECPELGPIGELLASDDFMNCSSVLVLEQHSVHQKMGRRKHVDHDTTLHACVS